METKKFRLSKREKEKEIPKLDSLEGYEDFIDNAYFESFGSLTVGPESLNTTQEYEEWIDKRYVAILGSLSQV